MELSGILLHFPQGCLQQHPHSTTDIKQESLAAAFMIGLRSKAVGGSFRSLFTMAPGITNSVMRDKFVVWRSHLQDLIAPLGSNPDTFLLKQLKNSLRSLSPFPPWWLLQALLLHFGVPNSLKGYSPLCLSFWSLYDGKESVHALLCHAESWISRGLNLTPKSMCWNLITNMLIVCKLSRVNHYVMASLEWIGESHLPKCPSVLKWQCPVLFSTHPCPWQLTECQVAETLWFLLW